MKELVNKNVEVLVSFAGGLNTGAAVPICYFGKLKSIENDFVTLECVGSRYATNTLLVINPKAFIDSSGSMSINKKYIIYIKEKNEKTTQA